MNRDSGVLSMGVLKNRIDRFAKWPFTLALPLAVCLLGGMVTTVGWAQMQPAYNRSYPPAYSPAYPPAAPYAPQTTPPQVQQNPYYPPPPAYGYPPAGAAPPAYPAYPAYPGHSGNSGRPAVQAGVNQLDGPENVLIILDASYSMKDKLPSGETKMAAAKRIILDVIRRLPPEKRVGLRIYGQSVNPITSCRASQLLVPIGVQNRNSIGTALIGVRPTGNTPITFAIKTALQQDFANLPSGKKTIILVSDGMETCDADPCDTAVEMIRKGVDVKINVVGFGLSDFDANRQLKCVALSTFGKFYSANTAAELSKSLENSMGAQTAVQGQIVPKSP